MIVYESEAALLSIISSPRFVLLRWTKLSIALRFSVIKTLLDELLGGGVEVSRIAVVIDYSRTNGKFLCFFAVFAASHAYGTSNSGYGYRGLQILYLVQDYPCICDVATFEYK